MKGSALYLNQSINPSISIQLFCILSQYIQRFISLYIIFFIYKTAKICQSKTPISKEQNMEAYSEQEKNIQETIPYVEISSSHSENDQQSDKTSKNQARCFNYMFIIGGIISDNSNIRSSN